MRLDPFRFSRTRRRRAGPLRRSTNRAWAGPAPGPFTPRQPPLPGTPPPPGVTVFDAAPGTPLLLRARFAVAEAARVRVLELRVAYDDGFVAYVNGREVARRGMAPAGTVAAAPHGAEVERVYVAVPSLAIPSLAPDGNVLAVAIYPSGGRNVVVPTAPAASVGLSAASGVRIVRGPYLVAPSRRAQARD